MVVEHLCRQEAYEVQVGLNNYSHVLLWLRMIIILFLTLQLDLNGLIF